MTAITSGGASVISETIDSGHMTTTQYLVVAVALLLNMLDGFDVTAMAFTVHQIGEELLISPDQLGIVFSVALAGMMLGAMFVAPYSDRIGRRGMALYCVAAIGLSMIATGFVTSLWQLIVLRLITGLGVGSMLAGLTALTSEYSPAKYRSLAVMVVTAGYPLGATAGGFIAAPMIPQYGWESVFIAGGSATLLMLVAVYFLMPESLQFLAAKRPPGALDQFNAILRKLGAAPSPNLPDIGEASEAHGASVRGLLTVRRRRQTLMLWTTFFFCFICLYYLMSWIPKLVVTAGLSESTGIYAAVIFNAGGVTGIVSGGWIASRMGLSRMISVFLCGAAALMVLFAVASGLDYLMIYLPVIGFLLQGGFTGLYAVAARIYPTELRSTGVGWAIGLGRFGAVVGPYVGGILIATGVTMEVGFMVYAVPLVIGGLLAIQLRVN